jgi:hypothetical protein
MFLEKYFPGGGELHQLSDEIDISRERGLAYALIERILLLRKGQGTHSVVRERKSRRKRGPPYQDASNPQ